ncbi:mRNA turnover protein 4 homolog [Trichonephila inaurata madagascariensis]|uniref:mRNA turnover protein 4 homolog n=1 Tax=Trichonephila inaurata madagascariensis TaxID=2747483 RepID=A0A8X6X4R7_9ARAC|nr:mRNA turnover protein 4 homolog [Trichonephila inaurata madagascariensis]
MPKSKRNKIVELTKTKKHGLEGKKQLYQQIQSNVENFAHVFIFSVNDMRNNKMKSIRDQWKHSRFCIGKNKIMAKALGLTEEDEFRLNLHKIGQQLKGERGLLFTNQPVEEVVNWFHSYSEGDYARSGNIATEDVILQEGPLKQFPHNLESYLRQLGLPTTLQKGVIHLLSEYVVCQAGDKLSPEAARILKLLGYEMAEFRIKIRSVWSQDGSFVDLDSEAKENKEDNQGPFMKSFKLAKCVADLENDEKMEVIEDGLNEAFSNSPKNLEDVQKSEQEVSKGRLSEKSERKIDSEAEKEINKEVLKTKEVEVITLAEENTNIEDMEELDVEKPTVKKSRASEKDLSKKSESKIDSKAEKEINKVLKTKEEVEVSTLAEENTNIEYIEESDVEKPTVKKSRASEKEINKEVLRTKEEVEVITLAEENTNIEDIEETDVEEPTVKKSRASEKEINKEVLKTKEEVEVITLVEENTNIEDMGESDVEEAKEEVGDAEDDSTKEADKAAMLKLTKQKIQSSKEKSDKFSPKLTRARAAAKNVKVKTPDSNVLIDSRVTRSSRKRKMI